jgi:hypothetical protein
MFIPSLFDSVNAILNSGQNNILFSIYSFNLGMYSALSWLVKAIEISFPILLLIMISNESFYDYGFNKISARDFILSLLRIFGLTAVISIIIGVINFGINIINNNGFSYDLLEKSFINEKTNLLMVFFNALPILSIVFTEELCFRSYLYVTA